MYRLFTGALILVLLIWIGDWMKLKIIPRLLKNLFKKPMTVRFPKESIPIPNGYRGVHEYDKEKCISCGLCAGICPNMAIEMVQNEEGKSYPVIDIGKCCFCGLCQDVCPTGALKLTKNLAPPIINQGKAVKHSIQNVRNKARDCMNFKWN